MATFGERLALRTPAEQQHVRDRLSALSATPIGTQAVRNIDGEHRLDAAQMDTLIDALLAETTIDPGSIKLRICLAMRTLKYPGGPVPLPSDTTFGRVIERDVFARRISKLSPFSSKQTIWKSVRYTLRHAPLAAIRKLWTSRPLGSYLMWSTFSLTAPDPFHHAFSCADEYRACLGMPPGDGPLITLRYTLPPSVSPHFPTIAEAYAGPQWNYYFAPAPPCSASGRTLPHDGTPERAPHNEVVHDIVHGDNLVDVPKIVR